MISDKKGVPPLVLVSGCRRIIDGHESDMAGLKYTAALVHSSHVMPVILPTMGDEINTVALLSCVDGLLLTGSYSDVHPSRYGEELEDQEMQLDTARDATVLPLILAAVRQEIPLFAICRGFQELNVAFGGTLHTRVHEVEGLMDHREDPSGSFEQQYAPAHSVTAAPGGMFEELIGASPVMVNSVHNQGVKDVGKGLKVEACAEDGLVEALSVRAAKVFSAGVQWHPEWKSTENIVSTALYRAFGDACRTRRENRQ